MTERRYATEQYLRATPATVVAVDRDERLVLLDRTVVYPGGGGQPPDRGTLRIGAGAGAGAGPDEAVDELVVLDARSDERGVWHRLDVTAGDAASPTGGLPPVGTAVEVAIDWERRHRLMRTHTAMHALCGIVWDRYRSPVTGGNMEPGQGRLDFELPGWDPEDRAPLEEALNAALAAALPVEIAFLPRAEADLDPSLIRTKVSLLPSTLTEVRVVDIVGLDRQADGGTHVATTAEVGAVRISKVESKGKGFRRIRIDLEDALAARPPA
jgi:misacylated tRNA(Ala) deacylase